MLSEEKLIKIEKAAQKGIDLYNEFCEWFDAGCESATNTKGWYRRVYASDVNERLYPAMKQLELIEELTGLPLIVKGGNDG